MQLRRLKVKNIRSYESADLEFTDGTTLLVGDVGAGKTSLLYAIEMALFGVAEVNAAYLVRHGASHAEVAVAFEEPEQRYEIFRRFRRLRRKGQETFEAERIRFTENGAETAYSATELRQRVIGLLGFPDNPSPQAHSDLWRWAVYVPQERMRDILAARPQDRLETVRKALGVERYRTAAENAQDLAADLRRSASSRRAEADRLRHFDEEFAEGNRQADRLRVDRVAVERAVRDREATVSMLRAESEELATKSRAAEADRRELASLEREQSTDQHSLEDGARVLADREAEATRRRAESLELAREADALTERRAGLAAAEVDLERLREDSEQHRADLRSLAETRALLASAEREEAEARAAVERTAAEEEVVKARHEEALRERPTKEPPAPTHESLAHLDERVELLRQREKGFLQSVAQAESSLAEVEELLREGVCPRCHQPVKPKEFGAHRAEAAGAVKTARANFAAVEKERAAAEEERRARERFERAHDRWTEVQRRRAESRAALDRATVAAEESVRRLASSENASASLRRRVEGLLPAESKEAAVREEVGRAEKARAERSREVERSVLADERRRGIERALEVLETETHRIERDRGVLRERLLERGRTIERLRANQGEAEALGRKFENVAGSLRAAEEELAHERSTLVRLDAQLDEAVRRVRAAEAGRRERAELIAEATEVDEKAAWVGSAFRTAVLGMEEKLLTHAQALFEREFARYFASLIDDPSLIARTDPAFTPLVMIEGEWTPAEALSGGERTSLALAFRLALAQVVRSMGSLHLDTILLDEPTDGFSPEQVVRMGELLEELTLPQVVLVSHESQLAAIADRVVRVRKVDGRSLLENDGRAARTTARASGPQAREPD